MTFTSGISSRLGLRSFRVIILALTLILCHAPGVNRAIASPTGNLLVNGGAETGVTDPWTVSDPNVVQAVTQVNQSTGTVTPKYGDYFFSFSGQPASIAWMSQSGSIDPSWQRLRLSAFAQTEGDGPIRDAGYAKIELFDASNNVLVTSTKSWGLLDGTFDNLAWDVNGVGICIPLEADHYTVTLSGMLHYGSYINVFWDNVSLIADDTYAGGDFNGDCTVDASDLALLLAGWGKTTPPLGWVSNWDGFVDANELAALLSSWGVGVGSPQPLEFAALAAIPEPTTLIFLAMGGLALCRTRNRKRVTGGDTGFYTKRCSFI